MLTQNLGRYGRCLRFGSVSATCFGLQYLLLWLAVDAGPRPAWLCNAGAFLISTQVNCALSQLVTWRDRTNRRRWAAFWQRFAPYNGVAGVSLLINTAGFYLFTVAAGWIGLPVRHPALLLLAQLGGAAAGMVFTYRICNRFLFRPGAAQMQVREAIRGLAPRPVASRPGVAVTMPAYDEAGNLRRTVEDFLNVLQEAGIDHTVVVCNDGSRDNTGALANDLVRDYPGRVLAVHHQDQSGQPFNLGYGAAVRSALQAGLATGHTWVLSTDSDGQFRAADLPGFLAAAERERVELMLGYRRHRADNWQRRLMGRAWTALSDLVFRCRARDVDCGYKLIWAPLLERLNLRGDAALISPELITKARAEGALVAQRAVHHFPRTSGAQTGSSPSVVLKSVLGVAKLYLDLVRSGYRWQRAARLVRPHDRLAHAVTLAALVAGVVSCGWYFRHGLTMAYPDTTAHLTIPRRVLDSPGAGLGQLGAVWLPLPHLLALWGVWQSGLYYSGLAGSVTSVLALAVAARYLAKTGRELSGHWLGGLVAAGVLLTNPNVLYLASTPMTEMLLLACLAAAVFYLIRWCRTGRWPPLAAASLATLLGCLTRYEAWVFLAAMLVVVVLVEWWRRSWRAARTALVGFGYMAAAAVPAWMAWGWLITKNPLYFQAGEFAKPSLWAGKGEPAIGHLGVAAQAYLDAMLANMGVPVAVLAVFGLSFFLVSAWRQPAVLAPLTLLVFGPFFVVSLYTGQRPLHVPAVNGNYYNVRFGLIMVLAAALFVGYLAGSMMGLRPRPWRMLAPVGSVAALVAVIALAIGNGTPATLADARTLRARPVEQASEVTATWLRQHYDGGLVLLENFSNETVTFKSRVPTHLVVYEGSNKDNLWHRALQDPAALGIRWVYMRQTPQPDDVWRALHDGSRLTAYVAVFHGPDQLIYRLRTGAPATSVLAQSSAPTPTDNLPRQRPAQTGTSNQTAPAAPTPASTASTASAKPMLLNQGIASWFWGGPGSCAAKGVAMGSRIRVVSPETGRVVLCTVQAIGPGIRGRVVNLARADFARLAAPMVGLVDVQLEVV